MSITASNNPFPDSPDPTPTKLDKGGYDGTAETLDTKINDTLAEAILLINNTLVGSASVGSIVPSSVPPAAGAVHAFATQAGTYANWGGFVVPANTFAFISRSANLVFSISQTTLDVTGKLNVSDVINTLTSTETTKPLSAAQGKVLNEKFNLYATDAEVATIETNLKNTISLVASGSPKGTYANLAALQAAFPSGNTNIYVTSNDGHWHYYNAGWQDGGLFQAPLTATIKSNESLSLAQRKGDVLYGILDQYTGEEITLSKVTGTPPIDNVIYFQLGMEYFKRNFKTLHASWFGIKNDGITDDYINLQSAINMASSFNAFLHLPEYSNIKISTALNITCSLFGNVSKIFYEGAVISSAFALNKEKIKIIGIEFFTENARRTVSFNFSNIDFINCKAISQYKANGTAEFEIALYTSTPISNCVIDNCEINGAIWFVFQKLQNAGNITIKNSKINCDFTHIAQDTYNQHDGITMRGVDGFYFINNRVNFKNTNRGFKFANAYDILVLDGSEVNFPTKNVFIEDNIIGFDSVNGKQVVDMFSATTDVHINKNRFTCVGEATVFEHKDDGVLPLGKNIYIKENIIYHTFNISYVKNNVVSLGSNLAIENNTFIFTPTTVAASKITLENGQSITIPFNQFLEVRNIETVNILNNSFLIQNGSDLLKDKCMLNFDFIKTLNFNNNTYSGLIVANSYVAGDVERDYVSIQNNTILNIKGYVISTVGQNVKVLSICNNKIVNLLNTVLVSLYLNASTFKFVEILSNYNFLPANISSSTIDRKKIDSVFVAKKTFTPNVVLNVGEEKELYLNFPDLQYPAVDQNYAWEISNTAYFENKMCVVRMLGGAGSYATFWVKNNSPISQTINIPLTLSVFLKQ